mmetsp:Transcript_987/g.3079  ORF Transcript_987/g.3079 Transcript_987/m.3079 type:complete len:145 (-) Transcript_987:1206-1640(-)
MAEISVRMLGLEDYESLFGLLCQLTQAPAVGREAFERQFQEQTSSGDYFVVVAEHKGKIVATATLLVERKFLRNCGKVGHIEDVVVDRAMRGKGVGAKLIKTLLIEAEERGCYKAILNCSEDNVAFYEKCGFEKKQLQMAKYFG